MKRGVMKRQINNKLVLERKTLATRHVLTLNDDRCVGCGICVKECATEAISGERKKLHRLDQVKCMRCGTCLVVCPPKIAAVEKHSPVRAVAS